MRTNPQFETGPNRCRQLQTCKNPEQARAILMDVLATVRQRKWTDAAYIVGDLISIPTEAKDLQDLVGLIEQNCQVCYKGSLLLSKAKLYDQVPLDGLYTEDTIVNRENDTETISKRNHFEIQNSTCMGALEDVFDKVTLDMMENAFCCTSIQKTEDTSYNDTVEHFIGKRPEEGTTIDYYDDYAAVERAIDSLLFGAAIFGTHYGIHVDRVIAVTQNVLDNNGIFVVEPSSYDPSEDDDYDDDDYDDDDYDDDDFEDDDDFDEDDFEDD